MSRVSKSAQLVALPKGNLLLPSRPHLTALADVIAWVALVSKLAAVVVGYQDVHEVLEEDELVLQELELRLSQEVELLTYLTE
jgi:hypothetical protein